MHSRKADKLFLSIVIVLTSAGFFIWLSASLGLLARDGARFSSVAVSQIVFGILAGGVAMYFTSRVPYRFWRKHALKILLLSISLMFLVYIPGLGFSHNGAKRWIDLGFVSFQPAEFFKIAFVIYFSAWASGFKEKVALFKYGLLPLLILLGIAGALLLSQPDTDTLIIMGFAGIAIYLSAGGRWKSVFGLVLAGAGGVAVLAYSRTYVMERILTFLDPSRDPLGAGYQIQQSIIAIGSGKIFGRGFGQSIQKFNYLPEPIGDSIFAVAAEEFGFVGSVLLIFLFVAFALRALKIASRSPDLFGGLLALGIVILIVSESFINIASMLGIVPLSGSPLLFVSHGGTALFFALAEAGIILNISRYQK